MLSGKTRRRIVAACAAAVVAGLVGGSAEGGQVIFDLRVLDTGGKTAEVYCNGDVVWMGLYAVIKGDNGRTDDDGLWGVSGSFLSSRGGLLGDLEAMPPAAPFNSFSATAGRQLDLDGDGDLDVGGLDPDYANDYFCAPAAGMRYDPPAEGFFLGQVRFTARTNDDASRTAVTYVPRAYNSAVLVLDGNILSSALNVLPISPAQPVTITASHPIAPAGPVRYLGGAINDHTSVGYETVKPESGSTLVLNTGLSVAAGGSLDLRDVAGNYGEHQVHIDDAISGNTGGTIYAKDIEIGYAGTGIFAQVGGLTDIKDSIIIGSAQTASGAVTLTGGKMYAQTLTCGRRGVASFVQRGGTTMVEYLMVGADAGSSGSVELSGNATLTVLQSGSIAGGGTGVLRQNGGIARFNNQLRVGGTDAVSGQPVRGAIELTGGQLSIGGLVIGGDGIGVMMQTGGAASMNDLEVASLAAVPDVIPATYSVDAGTITTTTLRVGESTGVHRYDASGRFTQTGGFVTSEHISVATMKGTAKIEIQGGRLSCVDLHVYAKGEFVQTDGDSSFESINLWDNRLQYSGGSMRINQKLEGFGGQLDFANAEVTLAIGDKALIDFSNETISNSSHASILAGPGSLLIFHEGFDPFTAFAKVQTAGLIHYVGEPLTIPKDTSIPGSGTIDGNVTNSGTIGADSSIGQTIINGQFEQSSTGAVAIDLAGQGAGNVDTVKVNGAATLDGSLLVDLKLGFVPGPTDTFTIITADAIQGRFANATDTVAFNGGIFDVVYTPTSVSLANYRAIPEPGGCAVLVLGAAGLLRRRQVARWHRGREYSPMPPEG